MKSLAISVDDYSAVLASICQDTSDDLEKNDTCVTSELVVSFLLVFCQLMFETIDDEKVHEIFFVVFLTSFRKIRVIQQNSHQRSQHMYAPTLMHLFFLCLVVLEFDLPGLNTGTC